MRDIARQNEKNRADLFRAVSQTMRIHEAIIEKDFWVCWILDYLFHDSPWKESLAFKGGTSLSKAFGLIQRFSEDIDLILDWRLLGYSEEAAWAERSATQQDIFGKEANLRTTAFLSNTMASVLQAALTERAAAPIAVEVRGQEVLVHYPKSFVLAAVQPQVILEIGPLAAWIPNEPRAISPYAAQQRPDLFTQTETTVRTIAAARTFWEKATILHQEAHRGKDKPLPPRYSRHYYDLYRMSRSSVAEEVLAQLELLDDVVQFKMRFYRCPWAGYEQAKPGCLRLAPPEHHLAALRQDYRAMQTLLFGKIPDFDEVLAGIAALERRINESETSAQQSAL
ncbi:MAG TPA: nucleotidyl transferase AbiEii/AbiGii toxin family protein [bacterium]|nr:nucleotidyl transferase AbiEii/AbiGii toxin family protein [bacterium]